MEITIDLKTCKIIIHIEKWNRYAIFIPNLGGEPMKLTIPQLIQAFEMAVGMVKKSKNRVKSA